MPSTYKSDWGSSDTTDFSSRAYLNTNVQQPHKTWSLKNYFRKARWNGDHQLLQSADVTPSISTSTTSTNLSNLQSNTTLNHHYIGRMKEENLRTAQPEIEPCLQQDQKSKNDFALNINADPDERELSEGLLEESGSKKTMFSRDMLPQLIAALAVSWVSMIIGYISAYTSPAELSLKKEFNIGEAELSWISGIMPLFALFGGLMGGSFIEYAGRKYTLLITDVLFLIAWGVNYFAQNHWYMYASRMFAGCGVGIASLTLPVYLGETIQPEVRGRLGLLPTGFGNIGILLSYLCGIALEWKGLAGIGALLPLPFFALIFMVPETPRWYISKGKIEESRKALEWLRGKNNPEAVQKEFNEIVKSQKAMDDKNDGLKDLFTRTNVKSLLIVLGLMFFQQMSGINAIIFYTTKIFDESGTQMQASLCTTIIGVVNFASSFIATMLIDRLGRKALLYISGVSMIITTGILGTYFYLYKVLLMDVSAFGWLPLASFIIYILGFSLGFGPVPWLMMGEILPAKIRGPAASVATGFNWTCTFIVTTAFPLVKDTFGFHSTFWTFGALTILAVVFTALFVPETRGQSLEDIERKLAGVKVRRMSSVANLKPLPGSF